MSITWDIWLVRYELDGVWHTALNDNGSEMRCGGKTGFKRACKRAMNEGNAMKWAHMTAVVREQDAGIPALHRRAENCFTL